MTNPFDRFEAERNSSAPRDDSRVDEGRDTTAGTAQDNTSGDAGYVDYRDMYGSGQQQGYAPAQDFGPAPQQQDYPAQDYPQGYSAPGPAPQQDGLTKRIVPIIAGVCALTLAAGVWFAMKGDPDPYQEYAERGPSGQLMYPKEYGLGHVPAKGVGDPHVVDGVEYFELPNAPASYGDLSKVDWGHPRLSLVAVAGKEDRFERDLAQCQTDKHDIDAAVLRCVYGKHSAILTYVVED